MISDRFKQALELFITRITSKYDFFAYYPCKVITQNGDGTLELQPENQLMPGMSKIPIRGLPGVTVKVSPGARVLVGFDNGDPSAPIATLFNTDSLVELTVTATTQVTVKAPLVKLSNAASLPAARMGDTVTVLSTAPGLPAYGQIITGNAEVIE